MGQKERREAAKSGAMCPVGLYAGMRTEEGEGVNHPV